MATPRRGMDEKQRNRAARNWLLACLGLGILGATLVYGIAYLLHRWLGI